MLQPQRGSSRLNISRIDRPAALRWGACILALLAVNILIFHDHWMGRSSFTFDFPEGYYATVAYWITSVQSGEWPQWIPYQSMGYPVLMNPQIGIFYPPFWLFVLLRIPYTLYAANIFQVLHVFWGSVGVLLLARRLYRSLIIAECGAVAFLFFGGFYSNAEHADFIRGFAWIPWLLWISLLNDNPKTIEWRGRTFHTCLVPSNAALSVFVVCFITGAYTGQMIAGLTMLALFVLAQAVRRSSLVGKRIALTDAGAQLFLIGLGVMMTAAFLLPTFYLTRELTRAQTTSGLVLWLYYPRYLFNFIFPSNLVHGGADYSMYGAQLPITLWIFLPLAALASLRKLFPFLLVASVAAVMCLAVTNPIAQVIRRLIPALGLSRFPAGEYREFIYLALLLLMLAGLRRAIDRSENVWRSTSLSLGVLIVFGFVCIAFMQHDLAPSFLQPFLKLMKQSLWMGVAAITVCVVARLTRAPALVVIGLPLLTVAAMMPVITGMKTFWSDPDAVKNYYTNQGFSLTRNGKLTTFGIFERADSSRPLRKTAANREWLSWRGYLDGSYMTNDSGGSISLSRAQVEAEPTLFRFVEAGSKLVGIECASETAVCSSTPPKVPVLRLPEVGRSVRYGRNSILYDVQVAGTSLAVENELYIAGWHALCDGKQIPVLKVDGALRGWIVPGGSHQVKLYYQTPFLKTGLFLAGLGLLSWVGCLAWLFVA